MPQQALRQDPRAGRALRPSPAQAIKGPSLTQDLLMLGDIYLTLAWMAFQRLRYGPAWQATQRGYAPPVVTMLRPKETDEEGGEATSQHRG